MLRASTRPESPTRVLAADVERWVEQALSTVSDVVVRTPVKRLKWLEPLVGVPVYAKLEFQQISGSFKFRGAWNALLHRTHADVIAASAGNHGLAIATAAHRLALAARIVIPVGASRLKRSKLVFEGAQLLEHGDSLEAASERARELAMSYEWDYVSPFADRRVIAGGATVMVEAVDQCPDALAEVIVPTGGGGLLAGATWAARSLGASVSVVGAEPENYASFSSSLNAGFPTRVLNQPTFADGLAVQLSTAESTLPWFLDEPETMITCTEEEIAAAAVALIQNESWLVEPSGAIGVAAVVKRAQQQVLSGPVMILLTGGNVQKSTLNRLLCFPFTEQTPLSRFLGLTGETPEERAKPRQIVYRVGARTESPPEDTSTAIAPHSSDEAIHLKVAHGDWLARHALSTRLLSEYQRYCSGHGIVIPSGLVDLAEKILEFASPTCSDNLIAAGADTFTTEASLRGLNILCSAVPRMFDWRSAAYDQSLVPQFFELRSQENSDVNYDRYGNPAVLRIESQLREVFRVDRDDVTCMVTSSGMAAYAIIEAYLVRHALPRQARVATAPYIYFEAAEQLESLPEISIERLRSYDAHEVADAVLEAGFDALFIDPIANNVELRVCDVALLARLLSRRLTRPLRLVVDGSMASAQLPSKLFCDEILANPNLEILYYESCSKYLQMGMEYSLAGVVVHHTSSRPFLERLRRNTGAILYSPDATLFPNYNADAYGAQLARIGANCRQLALALADSASVRRHVVVHSPALPTHVDHHQAAALTFTGGCVCMQFRDDGLNVADSMNAFIALVLAEARSAQVPLIKGVSFGFTTPRISAAAAIADSDRPFLRLYVGTLASPRLNRLARTVEIALERFMHAVAEDDHAH
ncbi:pyridoxal-phosphate dependent enzyme [Burkholderia sp. D-99]|uniref:pyridoxal-phosphate dependent enzyme n=1 Tax=Burkholderia sp. D-99 TaxID=2717316 RepID=UPI00141E22BD|nr:pyridoxal-phosphate dependent enzyme [Burkholderia sp. D-99]NHV28056.1 pyridoxal-phosphate dependent enzyme [Burkholderia sp. D-99]